MPAHEEASSRRTRDAPAMSEPKRLYRDPQQGVVGGVCAGVAEYAGMDPVLVRVLFVIAMIFTVVFPLLLVYLAMWALVPPKPLLPPAGVPPPMQQS